MIKHLNIIIRRLERRLQFAKFSLANDRIIQSRRSIASLSTLLPSSWYSSISAAADVQMSTPPGTSSSDYGSSAIGAQCLSTTPHPLPLSARRLLVEPSKQPKPKVPLEDLQFGHTFTDHMLTCEWSAEGGWCDPVIRQFDNISLPPAASVFHYGIECFEGMKAYKDSQGSIRLFRPEMNMRRFLAAAERLALPSFDPHELLELIERLVQMDESWIPQQPGYSLYVRPTLIATQDSLGVAPTKKALLFTICCPVGPYYRTGFNAVSLYAEDRFVRAWPGGTGSFKIGA